MAKKEHMKDKSDQELEKLLVATREKLRGERFSAAGARPEDPNMPGKLRKQVARILTERHARTK